MEIDGRTVFNMLPALLASYFIIQSVIIEECIDAEERFRRALERMRPPGERGRR